MEVNLLVLVVLGLLIFLICIVVVFSLIWPGRFSAFLKEVCLLTIGKIIPLPQICEAFIVR